MEQLLLIKPPEYQAPGDFLGGKFMMRNIFMAVAIFILVSVGLGEISVPYIPIDLIVGRGQWLVSMSFSEIPNLIAAIVRLIPVFLFLPFILLFAAGLLALTEMD